MRLVPQDLMFLPLNMSTHFQSPRYQARLNANSRFLRLPAELRNRIYHYVNITDLQTFADKMVKPGLLNTCPQLREEYSDVFFGNEALKIEAYHGGASSWHQVQNKLAKRAIFEDCVFTDLLDFWSVGSSRRYCQRIYSDWQGNVQTGIMTIITRSGIRRWQWSRAYAD